LFCKRWQQGIFVSTNGRLPTKYSIIIQDDFKVDLNKYHIVVRGDVFVAVEVVDVYTRAASPDIKSDEYKYDRLYISGTVFGSKCLRRKTNFDKWVKFEGIPGTFSIGFWLTVTY